LKNAKMVIDYIKRNTLKTYWKGFNIEKYLPLSNMITAENEEMKKWERRNLVQPDIEK